jgi:hypothetical protein
MLVGPGGPPPVASVGNGGAAPLSPRCQVADAPGIIAFDGSDTSPLGQMACDAGCVGDISIADSYAVQVDNASVAFAFTPRCIDATAFDGISFDLNWDQEVLSSARLSIASLDNTSEQLDGGTCPADASCAPSSFELLDLLRSADGSPARFVIPFRSLSGGQPAPPLKLTSLTELRWTFTGSSYIGFDNVAFVNQGPDVEPRITSTLED